MSWAEQYKAGMTVYRREIIKIYKFKQSFYKYLLTQTNLEKDFAVENKKRKDFKLFKATFLYYTNLQ